MHVGWSRLSRSYQADWGAFAVPLQITYHLSAGCSVSCRWQQVVGAVSSYCPLLASAEEDRPPHEQSCTLSKLCTGQVLLHGGSTMTYGLGRNRAVEEAAAAR